MAKSQLIKPDKGSALASMLRQTTAKTEDLLIPYLDSYILIKPNTGDFVVENRHKKGDKYFHPSGDCLRCKRQLFFRLSDRFEDKREDFKPPTLRTFAVGHSIHSLVQAWLKDMGTIQGFPHSAFGSEVRVFSEELNIRGSVDDIVLFPASGKLYLIEIKTMNGTAFNQLKAPKQEHQLQSRIYLHCLKNYSDLPPIEEAIVLYISKDYPHSLKEFKLKEGDVSPILKRWREVQEALIADDCSGLDWECRSDSRQEQNCPYSDICRKVLK